MLPVDHIVAGGMSPVHWSPVFAHRVMLIKRVITIVKPDQAVWIVHPSGRWREVKMGIESVTPVLMKFC
ncbi:Uncharacterised protein [Shigella sonnei]|nr:Uncharacterised protein [Shigella sonnei]CSR40234.1 Uncharacterised protein [Shigella sonnei]